MKHSYFRIFLFVAFTSLTVTLAAQQPWSGGGGGKKGPTIKGRISGMVIDTVSQQPV